MWAIFFFVGDATAQKENVIREHIIWEPETLNPLTSGSEPEGRIENQIFETLIRRNPVTLEPDIPWLAESLPVESADHKQFDFTLRKGIKFSDGVELTGADVIFTLKAIKNPFNRCSMTRGMAHQYAEFIKSVELIDHDQYKIRFILTKPNWEIREMFFSELFSIVPKHCLDPEKISDIYSWKDLAKYRGMNNDQIEAIMKKKSKNSADRAMRSQGEQLCTIESKHDSSQLIGSGPYKLAEWITNDKITLNRNPYYINKGGSPLGVTYPDTIIYKLITDWRATETAIKGNYVDLVSSFPSYLYPGIDTNKFRFLSKTALPQSNYTYIGWNNERPYFSDPKVRLALAHLIDRKTIIDKVLFGLGESVATPISPFRKEYNADIPLISFDPEKAKILLKEAGWEDHDGDGILDKEIDGKNVKFEFSFMTNSSNEVRKKTLLIIAEGMREIGIHADIIALDWTVFIDRLAEHEFDASYGAWQNDDGETDNFQLYHSSQTKNRGSNYYNWKSKGADKLLEGIRKEMDETKRIILEKEFQQVFYEEQPVAMLWEPYSPVVWNNKFTNVHWYPFHPGYNPAWWQSPK